jgi:deazaflavin-dependent oxidoreductase (nitroreductase family)
MSPLTQLGVRIGRRLLRLPALLYRWRLGFLLGRRFLLLEHVGRRTGHLHRTVLEVVAHTPPTTWYVMSGLGRSADWYRNISTAGHATIHIGGDTFAVTAQTVAPAEAADLLAGYEQRNRWLRPVLRAVLSRLAGWRYTATRADQLRLVEQLPIVALSAPRRPPADTRSRPAISPVLVATV